MQRTSFDFDVITGPAIRPAPKPPAKPTAEEQKPANTQSGVGGK